MELDTSRGGPTNLEAYGSKEELLVKSDDQIDTLEKQESGRATMQPVQSSAFEGKKSSPPTFSKGRQGIDQLGRLN